ncbi:helix-turn-helix domain-containing protein [Streptomyces torulosus]|uniref:helix-turn-helix domain-containing protein n=1 Tax=Streptomyces torulosus TaxID=68276 RepID=UPI0006EBD821|nr:helix-turn-helix transcriptional regulator [Streptomyces torulosus]
MGADNSDMAVLGGSGEPEVSDSLRTFGAMVQALREHAGLGREQLAESIGYSKHMVASVEQGRRLPDTAFVEGVDRALGGTRALLAAAQHLGRQPGLAAWFRKWAGLEATAIALYTYECRMIPGLLQTKAYARTLFEDRLPLLTDDEIEAQWTARAERQRLLRERPNASFSFIIEESVVLRQLGGPDVTRCLLDYMLQCAALRNASLQIMPLKRTLHASLSGPLQLVETPDGRRFAYAEGHMNGHLIAEPKDVAVLHQRYAKLRSQALTPEDSVSLLERLRGAL